jgi:hypothetical protein
MAAPAAALAGSYNFGQPSGQQGYQPPIQQHRIGQQAFGQPIQGWGTRQSFNEFMQQPEFGGYGGQSPYSRQSSSAQGQFTPLIQGGQQGFGASVYSMNVQPNTYGNRLVGSSGIVGSPPSHWAQSQPSFGASPYAGRFAANIPIQQGWRGQTLGEQTGVPQSGAGLAFGGYGMGSEPGYNWGTVKSLGQQPSFQEQAGFGGQSAFGYGQQQQSPSSLSSGQQSLSQPSLGTLGMSAQNIPGSQQGSQQSGQSLGSQSAFGYGQSPSIGSSRQLSGQPSPSQNQSSQSAQSQSSQTGGPSSLSTQTAYNPGGQQQDEYGNSSANDQQMAQNESEDQQQGEEEQE